MTDLEFDDACAIAEAVRTGKQSAETVTQAYLDRIRSQNPQLNAFTHVGETRALAQARAIDARRAKGETLGALAGVPFAVKNLFDIKGLTTLAGADHNRDHAPAERDAVLITRLEQEDAVLLGALNMGEYAYDFTGENCHFGNSLNPWDTTRMSGGSSGGCGSATGGRLAPLTLGSDTNGSIRVPSSFCGVWGLKPTYGRLPRTGSFPFCDSLDHLGPLACSVRDLALSFDVLQGHDHGDPACASRENIDCSSSLNDGVQDLRIARAAGYFDCDAFPDAARAVARVCKALGVTDTAELQGAAEGRAAAYLITNIEGAQLHLGRLRQAPERFDPDTRDRFLAGALLPASYYVRAQQVRHWYHEQALRTFREVDVLIAPCTPCVAPPSGTKTFTLRGETHLLRPNLGYFTQPISAIGLPSCVVPMLDDESGLPIGVQIIAAPWREDLCLRVARFSRRRGLHCSGITGMTLSLNKRLLGGIMLTIGLHAYDELVLLIALPSIADELALSAHYGATIAAYILAAVAGMSAAGRYIDALGPRRVLIAGLAALATGLLLAAFASSGALFVGARILQGLGGGIAVTCAFALLNLLSDANRKGQAVMAIDLAWVIPSLSAPAIGGVLIDFLHWRWIFLLQLPPLVLIAILLFPNLHKLDQHHAWPPLRVLTDALRIAVGCGAFLTIIGQPPGWAWALLPFTFWLTLPAFNRVMPEGWYKGATPLALPILISMLGFIAFYGMEAYQPLYLIDYAGLPSTLAGAILTTASLSWLTGSHLASRFHPSLSRVDSMLIGNLFLMCGVLCVGTVSLMAWSLWWMYPSWALAGLGMGFIFNASRAAAMENTPKKQEGFVATAITLAANMGIALSSGLGGATKNQIFASGGTLKEVLLAVVLLGIAVSLINVLLLQKRKRDFQHQPTH